MSLDFHSVGYIAMLTGAVSLNTTTITAINVSGTNMASRKWLFIQNASNVKIFIGSSSALGTAVTAHRLAKHGIKMQSNEKIWLPVGDNITVYGLAQTGAGKRLRIAEIG